MGKVYGGVAQGIGAAQFEEVVYDAQGQVLTANLRRLRHPLSRRNARHRHHPHRK